MALLEESVTMNSVFWTIRNLLADKSSNPLWYNGIQHFFGAHNMWSQFVQRYLPQNEPYQILDIGCGTATILNYLPENAAYIGIDSHKPYIDACNKRFSKRGSFICSDWNINFSVPKVDIVLLLGLLHHLSDDDAKQVIRLASNQLKSGGRLITLDGCREADRSSIEEFFYRIDRGSHVRPSQQLMTLFPSPPKLNIHQKWLRVPYRYAVCCWKK